MPDDPDDFDLKAKLLVDQHYGAGPDRLKQAISQALREERELSSGSAPDADPRGTLEREVAERIRASERGSE